MFFVFYATIQSEVEISNYIFVQMLSSDALELYVLLIRSGMSKEDLIILREEVYPCIVSTLFLMPFLYALLHNPFD